MTGCISTLGQDGGPGGDAGGSSCESTPRAHRSNHCPPIAGYDQDGHQRVDYHDE